MWQQADMWRIFLALISGIIVGFVYFQSLRWSVNRIHTFKHKWSVFGGIALFRIALFFAILVLVAHKNIVLLVIYLLAFFFTKIVIIWHEKHGLIQDKSKDENDNI
jgi:F1F0 ATPase subunit 2